MKAVCVKEKLREAVGIAERMTAKNLPLPVLSAIVFEAKEKNLFVRATNLEMGVEATVPSKVERMGICAVPAGILFNFIQHIPDNANITIEHSGGNLHLQTETTATSIKSVPVDDFPNIPKVTKDGTETAITISSDVLTEGLRAVAYAAAVSDIKPELATVNISLTEEGIVCVATDSFRLAQKKIILKKNKHEELTDNHPILIPIKNTQEIIRVLEAQKRDITLAFNDAQASFETDTIFITTRLVSGSYPDLSQVFPGKTATEAAIDKQEFLEALRATNVFTDKFNRIGLRIRPSEKLFEISSRSGEFGESVIKLSATTSGEDVDVFFNAKYILDAFQSIHGDTVVLRLVGNNRPLVISEAQNNTFTYLVMPLHA